MPVKLIMTSCQSSTDMIAMHGVDKDLFTTFRDYGLNEKTLAAFRTDKSGAVVGERIAARYGWRVGQNVTLKELDGISFNVSGVFSARGSADDFIILTGRRFLQEAVNQQGISNRVLVKLKPGANGTRVAQDIDAMPLTVDTVTQPEEAILSAALDQLSDLVAVSKWVIAVTLAVILIAMGNAVSMAVRERTGEFAILRTLGFQKGTILMMVLTEGAVQALAGGALGCLIVQAIVSANLIKAVSTCGFTVNLTAGPYTWIAGLTAIAIASVAGCVVPAWSVSRLPIVAAIRQED